MPFDAEEPMTAEAVQRRVETKIEENNVVLFMKGSEYMPQCGYSRSALAVLNRYCDDVEVVNVLAGPTDEYRAALESRTGWSTIPQAFADQEFLGGADVLQRLDENGDLAEKLDEEPASAPF